MHQACMTGQERPEGVVVQFGGQTPLSIAKPLAQALAENPIPAASGANCRNIGSSPFWLQVLLWCWRHMHIVAHGSLQQIHMG